MSDCALKLLEVLALEHYNGDQARFANNGMRIQFTDEQWKHAGKPVTVTVTVEKNS